MQIPRLCKVDVSEHIAHHQYSVFKQTSLLYAIQKKQLNHQCKPGMVSEQLT